MTVIEEATLCEKVAVTVTFVSADAAKARHISDVPLWTFVLTTSAQVKPAPVTLDTTVLVPEIKSVEIKARSNSFPDVVENEDVATVELFVPLSTDVFASIEIPDEAVAVKLTPPMLTPLTVTGELVGLNVNPDFEGVTVYVPFNRLPNV
jgi:hypothetical protein